MQHARDNKNSWAESSGNNNNNNRLKNRSHQWGKQKKKNKVNISIFSNNENWIVEELDKKYINISWMTVFQFSHKL